MKYQSELIKEIVESRGHEKSSIHYESECIEKWIEETKGAYPKLCDYQSEWLNYINENPIGNFPYETVTNVTEATVNNVVPYEYKSAILKGQTLVNIVPSSYYVDIQDITTEWSYSKFLYLPNNGLSNDIKALQSVKSNTKYLLRFYVEKNTVSDTFRINNPSEISIFSTPVGIEGGKTGWFNFVLTTKDITDKTIAIRIQNGNAINGDVKINKIMLIEYVDGMENWDIPYFEGMKSVQMPVLTTTGKNIFGGELINGYINSSGNWVGSSNNIGCKDFISVAPNDKVAISLYDESLTRVKLSTYVRFYDINFNAIGSNIHFANSQDVIATAPTNAKYLKFYYTGTTKLNVQIEQNSIITTYEPYKSNILTVNEDVTLRGIGDVKEELDCLTGEVTERIGKIILDGTQSSVTYNSEYSNDDYYCFMYDITKNGYKKAPSSPIGISCPIPFQQNRMFGWETAKEFVLIDGNDLVVKLLKSRLSNDNSISTLNTYLASNPITINYPLMVESIKTVDLTILDQYGQNVKQLMTFNGGTHFNAKSLEGSPLPSISVTVETDLVETLKVCSLDGNTM